jgi:hypothetical protein
MEEYMFNIHSQFLGLNLPLHDDRHQDGHENPQVSLATEPCPEPTESSPHHHNTKQQTHPILYCFCYCYAVLLCYHFHYLIVII